MNKLYTWEDLCDYEWILLRKWQLGNELKLYDPPYGQNFVDDYSKLQKKMRIKEIEALNELVKKLGKKVSDEMWEEYNNA